MDLVTCPYCNTQLSEPAPRVCPRCGEPMPASEATTSPGDVAAGATGSAPADTGYSNRAVAGIVLGLMGVMALVGLVFALWTKSFREKNNLKVSREAIATPANPLDVPGLGYLPPDTNLVAALRPADLLEHPLGKSLLAAPRPALVELALSRAEQWTGVRADNIDHLVAGVALTPEKIPALTLVVQTRQPYDPAAIAKALGSRATLHQGLPLFEFHRVPVHGCLLCVGERVMVMVLRVVEGMKKDDLDNIPRPPWHGADGLPKPLREVIGRMDKDALAWVAADSSDKTLRELLLTLKQDEPAQMLAQVSSFGLWLVPEEKSVRLSGALRGRTQQAAAELPARVESWSSPVMPLVVHGPPSLAALAAGQVGLGTLTPPSLALVSLASLAGNLPRGEDAFWVSLQARVSVENLRELMQRHTFTLRAQ